MKKERIKEIIKKGKVNIRGYIYDIQYSEYSDEVIELIPRGTGSRASSDTKWDDYGYTHGGEIYLLAVDIAHEIAEVEREERAKDSDV